MFLSQALECYKNGESKTIFVVPTHRYALNLRQNFISLAPDNWQSPPVYSLEEFLKLFIPGTLATRNILSEEESAFLVRRITLEDSEKYRALFLSRPDPFPNVIASISRLIREMKEEGIAPEHLAKTLGAEENMGMIQSLFRSYEEFLRTHHLTDRADILRIALENVSPSTVKKILPLGEKIIFDGIDVFPGLFIEFLKALGKAVPQTIVLVEYEPGRPLLFRHMVEAVGRLTACAASVHSASRQDLSYDRKRLIEEMYKGDPASLPCVAVSDFVSINALPDRLREVEFIARTIKHLALDQSQNLSLSDICVCFPSLDRYSPLVCEIFEEYGIPYNLSLGVSLAQIPIIKALDYFLTVVESDFERTAFLRLLNNPYYSIGDLVPEENRPSSESVLECIKGLRVNRGGAEWIKALEKHIHNLKSKILRIETGEILPEETGGDSPEEMLHSLRAELEEKNKIRIALESFLKMAKPFGEEHDFSYFSNHVRECIRKLLIPHQLFHPGDGNVRISLIEQDIHALEEFHDTLYHLNALNALFGMKPVPFSQFVQELKVSVTQKIFYPVKTKYDAVQVLGRLEPRLFSFRYFFLAGLLDGEFPHSPPPQLFLKAKERKKIGLGSAPETLAADRFLFRHFLSQTRDRLFLTYPSQEEENPLVPSPILDEIRRCTGLEPVKPADDGYIHSERELQASLGREISRNGFGSDKAASLLSLYSQLPHPGYNPGQCREDIESFMKQNRTEVNIPLTPPPQERTYYSISQLEEYGRCPFHYYARRMLHLSEPLEWEEEITALERGNVIHSALYRFYRERAKTGKIFITSPEEAEEAKARLAAYAREEMRDLPYRDLFWEAEKERICGGDSPEERPGLLRLFIEKELEFYSWSDGAYKPEFFESSFGRVPGSKKDPDPLSGREPFIIDYPQGQILLRGKIDRIELSGDLFAVVDYKTGGALPDIHDLEEGVSLQLAIYLLAARERLKRCFKKDFHPAGGIFYQIHSETKIKRDSQIILKSERKPLLGSERKRTFSETPEDLERLLDLAREHVRRHVTGIRSGRFPVSFLKPDKALCRVCAFRLACRRKIGRMFRRKT